MRQLEARLPPEIFAAAIARGRARQIDDVVAELVGDRPINSHGSNTGW